MSLLALIGFMTRSGADRRLSCVSSFTIVQSQPDSCQGLQPAASKVEVDLVT